MKVCRQEEGEGNAIKSSQIGKRCHSYNLHRMCNVTLGNTLKVDKISTIEYLLFCAVNTECRKPKASKVQQIHCLLFL